MLFYGLFRHEPALTRVKADHYLFREGDAARLMYVLVSGRAQMLVGEQVLEELEPGGVLGEMALVDQVPRSTSILAISDCEFACISQKRFHFLVSQTPDFATEVQRTMARRLRKTAKLLA